LATVSATLDESEQFADNEVELHRAGGVKAAVASRDPAIQVLILLLGIWYAKLQFARLPKLID